MVGRRDADTVVQLFTDFYGRTDDYLPELICTDEYAVYRTVILDTYGVLRSKLPARDQSDRRAASAAVTSAQRERGRATTGERYG